nr:hypothetical protein [Bacillus coahuilensis]
MSNSERYQLNVRVSKDTHKMLEEIVLFYEENTKFGRVYKGDVLADIIEKAYEQMNKTKSNETLLLGES